MNTLQLNDVGTTFVLTVKEQDPDDPCTLVAVDISAATGMAVKFEKPDGTAISRTGTLNTDGLDGKMKYTTIAGDIDQAGRWKVQAAAVIGGWNGRSEVVAFQVRTNIT